MKNPIIWFVVFTVGLCYYAMASNDPNRSGNGNRCVGDCYENHVAANGNIVEQEQRKQELLAQASPADLGKKYYAQCIGCHGANGEGGVGPKLAGQDAFTIANKLMSYRSGETLGAQSMLMWSVAKPMTDADIDNLGAHVETLKK